MSNHPIVHLELSSENHHKMKSFYGAVFGWEFQDFPEMNYVTANTGEGSTGVGFNPVGDQNPAGTIVTYIECGDIQASLANVESNGGKVVVPPMDIPGVGKIAHFTDPSGNLMAVLQPAPAE